MPDGLRLLAAQVGQLDISVAAGQARFEEAVGVRLGKCHVGGALPVPDKDQFADDTHDRDPIRGAEAPTKYGRALTGGRDRRYPVA